MSLRRIPRLPENLATVIAQRYPWGTVVAINGQACDAGTWQDALVAKYGPSSGASEGPLSYTVDTAQVVVTLQRPSAPTPSLATHRVFLDLTSGRVLAEQG